MKDLHFLQYLFCIYPLFHTSLEKKAVYFLFANIAKNLKNREQRDALKIAIFFKMHIETLFSDSVSLTLYFQAFSEIKIFLKNKK